MKTFNPEDRFLSVNVYKFPLGNCGGITDKVQTIYIPNEEGNLKFKDLDPNLVFYPEQRGPEYWALKPIIEPEGMCGPMAGGNLAYSGDSRSKKVYHIHDRFETGEQYETLSR